jgi:hypothetical protein
MLAERYNCTKSSVHGALKRFVNIIGSPSLTDAYEDNKANVLGSLQLKTLEYLADDKTLKKASANNLAYLFTQLHNAQRLEQGRSTSNIGISVESHLTKALEQASSTDDVV